MSVEKETTYLFSANYYAQQIFNLEANKMESEADGAMQAIKDVIGHDNYEAYVIAQDPFAYGKTHGEITINRNRGRSDTSEYNFQLIGNIYKIER